MLKFILPKFSLGGPIVAAVRLASAARGGAAPVVAKAPLAGLPVQVDVSLVKVAIIVGLGR